MSFVIRPAKHDDINQLVDLAKQFNLLNLPGEKRILQHKIETSEKMYDNCLKKTVFI